MANLKCPYCNKRFTGNFYSFRTHVVFKHPEKISEAERVWNIGLQNIASTDKRARERPDFGFVRDAQAWKIKGRRNFERGPIYGFGQKSVNLAKSVGTSAKWFGIRTKNFFLLTLFWVLVKAALLYFFPPLRTLLNLPYEILTVGDASTPRFIAGVILSIGAYAFYLFYLNPFDYFFDYKEKRFKITNLIILGIVLGVSLIIHVSFNNLTMSFFSFLILLSLGSFYLRMHDKHRPAFYWFCGLVLGLILFSIFFNEAFVKTGRYSSVLDPVNDKLGIKGDSVSDIWNYIFNPEKARDFGSVEDDELEKKDIGVEIKDFKPAINTFNSGQPITVRGVLEAASLYSEESSVKFTCELERYDNSEENVNINPETTTLPANAIKLTQTVSCIFKNGVNISKGLDTRSASLISTFDNFYTTSSYNVFSLESTRYNEIYQQKKNPFDVYGWSTEYLSPGNIMNSRYSPGPVELSIGTEIPQPFKSGDTNLFFEILISKDNQVKLNKITDFKVYVPSDMIRFKGDEHCDLVKLNSENLNLESDRDVYVIKEDKLTKGLDYRDDQITYGCFFDIGELSEKGQFREDVINAEMTYSFDIIEKTPVTIRAEVKNSPLL